MSSGAGRAHAQVTPAPIGIFTGHTDIGTVLHPGFVQYDAARRTYTITGSGENVWFAADAFQFVWKKVEGDFTLTADISILGQGGDPHRKAMLMARQSLDPDSAYADVALHGVGLTSLQSREAKGEATHEVQANVSAPKRVRLLKWGDDLSLWIAGEDGRFQPSGAAMQVALRGAFYVGLGVCAHDKDAMETAVFSRVELKHVPAVTVFGPSESALETISVASTDRRVTYASSLPDLGSPIWTPDGASLVFRRHEGLGIVPVAGGAPKLIKTGFNGGNDFCHSISPDGRMLAFGHHSRFNRTDVYVVPIGGGRPRRVTRKSPSDSPSWSPDGKTLIFSRRMQDRVGIYTIPAAGGEEKLLVSTASGGFAEYSPDGRYIYFNSNVSGPMEVWRVGPDGSQPEQLTHDGAGNWCPHVSPDGRSLAFITTAQQDSFAAVPVALRVLTLADGQIRTLAKFLGGPTSIPSPCWSPDGKRIAFASLQGQR